nr:retrotransposon protein, putative, Ty1-copia subclass [Tanacetum cinerariifolium]
PTCPDHDPETTNPDTIDKYYETVNLEQEVAFLMLSSMSLDLQRTLEKYNAYDMLKELKTMFEEQAKQELFETIKAFHACKQEEGHSISSYLLNIKCYLETLERLGYDMPNELGMSLILNSLNKDYDQFIQNYNKHSMGKTIAKLHAMLKFHEKCISKKAITPAMLAIWEGKIQKDKKKREGKRGLRESRKLKHRALSLYMGNGMCAAVEAIGSFDLILPNGLIIVLDDFHIAPSVTRSVVSISRLVNNCYIHIFTNYGIFVLKDNVFYFNEIPRDGIYEIDMHNLYPNKRMDKLQRDGILQPTHDESLKTCKLCISRKKERKLFPHQVERAKDLLGLKHTDSDRGGEYMSHEFVNHMKSCGIVSQLTPPYTPQHNGVSKRRNQTLLDMVRSMMNLTTLPKPFWVYAFEFAARILNMVPTKKVKRMPYEIWHGKASKLSYLRVWGSMNTKMQSMKDNQVWVLVDLPPNGRTVRSKWLFKKKTDMDSNVYTFKAHLVAKGYTQIYGVDCRETFSPVTYIRAIRILLAIATFYDYEIWQMYVITAFLNGYLSEDVYMVQLKGFVDLKNPNKVCKLQRSIYGLKQASITWYKRFNVEIKKIGFTQNPNEPCVYLKASGSNVVFLILYVDDVLLMGNNVTMLQEVKSLLCKCFSMKDLAEEAYILGIKIIHDRSKWLIALSQSAYLKKILKKFWMEKYKKGVPYALAIGSIIYAVRCIRLDVALAQNLCSPFQQNAEAEHIAAIEALMEADWMRKFIDGLRGVMPSNKRPMEMLCDNEPAIAIANDPSILKGARHFQRK